MWIILISGVAVREATTRESTVMLYQIDFLLSSLTTVTVLNTNCWLKCKTRTEGNKVHQYTFSKHLLNLWHLEEQERESREVWRLRRGKWVVTQMSAQISGSLVSYRLQRKYQFSPSAISVFVCQQIAYWFLPQLRRVQITPGPKQQTSQSVCFRLLCVCVRTVEVVSNQLSSRVW